MNTTPSTMNKTAFHHFPALSYFFLKKDFIKKNTKKQKNEIKEADISNIFHDHNHIVSTVRKGGRGNLTAS